LKQKIHKRKRDLREIDVDTRYLIYSKRDLI